MIFYKFIKYDKMNPISRRNFLSDFKKGKSLIRKGSARFRIL
ncbi:hypothetical protein LEP1GSC047_2401 [Leptospira inadai serovar Lyme str. 10]|uniref:Uncharacterized protein n=1 Tax=Leptospira inadai serovar Lyme str. 10 TaxID=1049790 RepID=V6HNK5_9LEPT|nr:hypothetical protein LEP1GSC047_2401 [Leptospira inadai serovar Lyme str. 10]